MGSAAPVQDGKYARVERERRFLLPAPPAAAAPAPRRIYDRYVTGTRLRLRRVEHLGSGQTELKLTQKIPAGAAGPVRGLITNMYLAEAEYDVLAALPAAVLTKTRVSIPPLGVDIFDPPLDGLVVAEAEFADDDEAVRFRPPPESIAEVTDDPRFTGGRLALTKRHELLVWLAEYGVAAS
jgi:CYTH domain-containing protein